MAKVRVLVGLNYPVGDGSGKEKRAEPGDVVSDIPEKAEKWLLRDGFVEPATERKPSNKAAKTKEVKAAVAEAEQPAEIPEKLEEIREGDE